MIGGPGRSIPAAFRSEEGGPQGDPLSSLGFAILVKRPLENANNTLKPVGGNASSFVDDINGVGPPALIFGTVLPALKADLAAVGLELRPEKSSCYIREDFRDADFIHLQTETRIPLDTILTADNSTAAGIMVYGAPIGDTAYIKAFLTRKAQLLKQEQQVLIDLLHPNKHDPSFPTRQCLLQQLLKCLRHQPNFYFRHIDPELTEDFASSIQTLHNELLNTIIDKDITKESQFTQQRLQLPIRHKGAGLTSHATRRFIEYIGGVSQGCRDFLDRVEQVTADDGTVTTITHKGFLSVDPIVNLFGAGSFNSDNATPWETLLSHHNDSAFASSLGKCWDALTASVKEINVRNDPSLFDRDAAAAGTGDDGVMLSPSVTTHLAREYDRLFRDYVDGLPKDSNQETLSWLETTRLASQFLLAAPNNIGYIQNRLLLEIFASYFGIKSPNFSNGGYIGRQNPVVVVRIDTQQRCTLCPSSSGGA